MGRETDAVFEKSFHHFNLTLSQESSHSHWLRNTFSSSCRREAHVMTETVIQQVVHMGSYQSHDWDFGLELKRKEFQKTSC